MKDKQKLSSILCNLFLSCYIKLSTAQTETLDSAK